MGKHEWRWQRTDIDNKTKLWHCDRCNSKINLVWGIEPLLDRLVQIAQMTCDEVIVARVLKD